MEESSTHIVDTCKIGNGMPRDELKEKQKSQFYRMLEFFVDIIYYYMCIFIDLTKVEKREDKHDSFNPSKRKFLKRCTYLNLFSLSSNE